jgi:aconitate decarboxylase
MNATGAFADFLLESARAGLSPRAREVAIRLFCDGIAVAALGAREAAPQLLYLQAAESGGVPHATPIAQGAQSLPASTVARINGAAMHVLDYEPMWNPANHSLSTTLPALLALAEMRGDIDGARLLTALATGIEAQARLRQASGMFEPGEFIFHPPGMVGAIGSAVGCGILLGLDSEKLAMAIGIAASRAGALIANVGSMTKCLHCGDAAAGGLEAALLAARGFTADADAIGNPRGWGRAFGGARFDPAVLTAPTADWHIGSPGPAFKLYPSQYGTHFVIMAALDARRKWHAKGSIERVTITAPAMAYVDRPVPASGLAGKFSFQFTAAAALLDGDVTVASFTDERRYAQDMVELLPCIQMIPDPSRKGRFDEMRVDVALTLDDGETFCGSCDGPPGIWGRPVPNDRLEAKWRDCLAGAYGPLHAATLLQKMMEIAKCDATALRDLAHSLARGGAG